MTPLLEIRNLKKTFGSLCAVSGASFVLEPGICLGLLGPNGAGKTTTLSMMTGLVTPDQGEVLIEGKVIARDTDPVKTKIGLVPQDLALFEELSALDNLRLFGALYHLERTKLAEAISSALNLVGLADRAKDKVKKFSGGMKRRLNLAAALLHDPQLLLLDEPTVGVDPQSRNAIFDNIEVLLGRGKTVIYTTHYMEEVERLCDRVVIMDHGKVIADDTLETLRSRAASGSCLKIELGSRTSPAWLDELRKMAGITAANLESNQLTVELQDLGAGTSQVLNFLQGKGEKILQLASDQPDLESVFLSLTGKQLRDL